MDELLVATLNIRNLADRWSERLGFNRPDPEDLGLLPSDRFGIAARLELGLWDRRWEDR
jgi:hypothetical protein